MLKNKLGQLGGFITTFVATIIIVILISVFLLFAGVIKSNAEAHTGEAVFREDSLGIEDGVGYMEDYFKLVEVRSKYHSGSNFEEAMSEVGYYG
jgi:hypothetical protein